MSAHIRFFFVKRRPSGAIAYLGRIIETDAGVASESYYGGSWHSENHFMRYLTDPLGVDELEESEVPMYMAEIDRGT